MQNNQTADFTVDQFTKQNKDVTWLCEALREAEYGLGGLRSPANTVEWLNEALQHTGFFDSLMAEKTTLSLTDEIKKLRDETAGTRKGSFEDLPARERDAVKRLNRLALEEAYPRETPECGYQLTALIRNRKGDNFLQEYQTADDFRQDMKDHRADIEWAFLVRADQGRVIGDYYSDMGDRDTIGMDQIEPDAVLAPEGVSPQEASLREAAIRLFKSNKNKRYMLSHMNHINGYLQVSESIKFLFDDKGQPAALPPLEDIVAEREKMEIKIKWLEAIVSELHIALASLKEVEEGVLEQLVGESGTR